MSSLRKPPTQAISMPKRCCACRRTPPAPAAATARRRWRGLRGLREGRRSRPLARGLQSGLAETARLRRAGRRPRRGGCLPRREANCAIAQFYLGTLYQDGELVGFDEAKAIRWLRRRPTRTTPRPQPPGRGLCAGRGVPEDDVKGTDYYRRAADLGDPRAMLNMPALEQGVGTERNTGPPSPITAAPPNRRRSGNPATSPTSRSNGWARRNPPGHDPRMSQSARPRRRRRLYSRADQARVEPLIAGLKARGPRLVRQGHPRRRAVGEIIARNTGRAGAVLRLAGLARLAALLGGSLDRPHARQADHSDPARSAETADDLPDRFVLTLQARNTVEAHGRAASGEGCRSSARSPGSASRGLPPPAPWPRPCRGNPARERRGGARSSPSAARRWRSPWSPRLSSSASGRDAGFKPWLPTAASPVASAKPAKPALARSRASLAAAASPTAAAADEARSPSPSTRPATEGDTPVATLARPAGQRQRLGGDRRRRLARQRISRLRRHGGQEIGHARLKPVMTAGRYEARVFLDPASGDRAVRPARPSRSRPVAGPHPRPRRLSGGEPVGDDHRPAQQRQDWVALAEEGAEPGDFVSTRLYRRRHGGDAAPRAA